MKIYLSEIKRDSLGQIEQPTVLLKKPHGESIGTLGLYFNLKMELKYNELSTVSFDYPAYNNGQSVSFYNSLIGGRVVQIDPYGIFILDNPSVKGDGIKEVKTCKGKSLEYELSNKHIDLEEGTYKLYNALDPTDNTTIIGRILETTRHWSIGSVSTSLYNVYRTFSDTSDDVFGFMLNTLQKPFGCIFVFDVYNRTIDIIDSSENVDTLPIYISYDNLIKESEVNEKDDNLYTKITVNGADDLDIRSVNPIGSNYIYNLEHPIEKGDIPSPLATRWHDWVNSIIANQQYFIGLNALKYTAYSNYLTAKAALTDLNSELTSIDNQISTVTQGYSSATTETTKTYYEELIATLTSEYSDKEDEISTQSDTVNSLLTEYNTLLTYVSNLVSTLKYENFFTSDELDTLDYYLIEGDLTDPTFATVETSISTEGTYSNLDSYTITLNNITLTDVQTSEITGRRIMNISGGSIIISGSDYSISSELVSAIIDHKTDGTFVMSAYVGFGSINDTPFTSGTLTCTGTAIYDDDDLLDDMIATITTTTLNGVSFEETEYSGNVSLTVTNGSAYLTQNVTEYQKYSVAKSLYDYATEQMQDIAYPSYEFSIDSGNFIFAKVFEPFKNVVQLGKSVYLNLESNLQIRPILLEVHLNFEDPTDFKIIFSNEFKRPDETNTLKDKISNAVSTSRTFDSSKFEYGAYSTSAQSTVTDFIQNGLDLATQQVTVSSGQNILMNGSGFKTWADGSSEYIKIANGMISLVDSFSSTSKMAIGHFYNEATGESYYGVIGDVIAGKLLAGNQLTIECENTTGIMQFRVDSSGAFLNNSQFYLQSDSGGKIALHPDWGIIGGTSSLLTISDDGSTVVPSFIDSGGDIIFDDDGMPENANFYVSIEDGSAYFRGKVIASSGLFQGVVQASDYLNSSGSSILTNEGKFKSDYLDLGNITLDGATGDITMDGSITLGGDINITGDINWSSSNSPVVSQYSVDGSTSWHSTYASTDYYARYSYDGGTTWTNAIKIQGIDGTNGVDGSDANVPGYIQDTYIDMTQVSSPYIQANLLNVITPNSTSLESGIQLQGYYDSTLYNVFKLSYYPSGAPTITFDSPSGGYAHWDFDVTNITSAISFGSGSRINLTNCTITDWGDNAPVAVFG